VLRNLLVIFEMIALCLMFMYYKISLDRSAIIYGRSLIVIVYISSFLLLNLTTADNYIFLIVTILFSVGIIVISRINPQHGFKQIVWIGLGIVLFFATYFMIKKIKILKSWFIYYFFASIALFGMTLLLGERFKGPINWISIGGITFQPTEVIKILTIFL